MDRNYLLFVPSLLSRAEDVRYTVSDWDKEYLGAQTNEAVTKYLIDYLERTEQKLYKIIMLCTDEVREKHLEQIGGNTTYQYYCEKIMNFLKQAGIPFDEKELFVPIPYLPQENDSIDRMIEPLEEIIKNTGDNNERQKLYVDFTGGIRSAALTLVFACRILQSYGIKVEKILYSNIGTRKIEECTRTYRLFDYLSIQLEKEYDNEGRIVEYLSYELEEKDKQRVFELIEGWRRINKAKRTNKTEELTQEVKNISKYQDVKITQFGARNIINHIIDENKELADCPKQVDLYLLKKALEKGNDGEALRLFREKIISIMFTNNIIKNTKGRENKPLKEKEVTNELLGAYYYYGYFPKENCRINSGKKTFMDTVKEYIQFLNQSPNSSPKNIQAKYIGERFYRLNNYLNKEIPEYGIPTSRFLEDKCNRVIVPQLKKMNLEKMNVEEYIVCFQNMQRIYTGYGYPFACTYNNWILDGYDAVYKEIFEEGVNSLDKYFKGEADERINNILKRCPEKEIDYIKLIKTLEVREELLCYLFPFQVKRIRSEKIRWKEWNEFLFDFATSFCFIKGIRNKDTHKAGYDEDELNEAILEIKKVLDKIENYIE